MVMRRLQNKKKSSVSVGRSKAPVASEYAHCKAFWEWSQLQANNIPELRTMFHTPNEGRRSPITAARLKAIGLVPGVWDYILPAPRYVEGGLRCGLIIEFKSGGGALSDSQKSWGTMMMENGFASFVAWDWEDAKVAVLSYLGAHGAVRTAN